MQQERYREPYPGYLSRQYEGYNERIHPKEYRMSVMRMFQTAIFFLLSIVFVVVVGFLLITIHNMRLYEQQLQQAIQNDSHVCGVSYLHDGTPVILKTHVKFTIDPQGHISKSTDCN